MKKAIIIPALLFSFLLSACTVSLPFIGERTIGKPAVYIDLRGEWVQTNSHNGDKYLGIYITEDYIEAYWVFDNLTGASLYYS